MPGESEGPRSLVGYSPWGHKESDTTERLHFPGGSMVKNLTANAGDTVQSLSWEDTLEKEMATHTSILAWKIHGQRSQWVTSIGLQKK